MATTEPGRLFQFDKPVERAQVDAVLVRELFTALARTNYTTDEAYPASPREGMVRFNAADPNNVKLQFWQGSPGVWRTVLQHMQGGIAAPAKQVVQIVAPATVWTIDHNLGTQPIVQVFDTSFNLLVPSTAADVPRLLAHVPAAVLTSRTGVQALRSALAMGGTSGSIIGTRVEVAEAVSGAPIGQIQFTLSGAGGPMVGGEIPITVAGLGLTLPGNPVTGNNVYSPGDSLLIQTNFTTAPLAGALDIYADVLGGSGGHTVQHPTENRVVITHPLPAQGYVVLIG